MYIFKTQKLLVRSPFSRDVPAANTLEACSCFQHIRMAKDSVVLNYQSPAILPIFS